MGKPRDKIGNNFMEKWKDKLKKWEVGKPVDKNWEKLHGKVGGIIGKMGGGKTLQQKLAETT